VAIHPDDILAGYRVTRLLGRGGMGEVWAAVSDGGPGHEDRAGLPVAIKVLLARAAMKPDLVRRFEREAKIASAIKSPFVCQLIEVAESDDGALLLIFEQLSGESLADRLKREQYLPFSEVGPIVDDVLQGLVAAHEAGVVHRDLKPGNIFLVDQSSDAPPPPGEPYPERRERAKILDFGISKLNRRAGEREPTLTRFDATLGSFAYMAPEQVRGAARADERADIYAVGAVAFRALSGRLPFEGPSAHVLVGLKLDTAAPSLAEVTGERWPAGVERFLERALSRPREERFASASEALAAWRSIQPAVALAAKPGHDGGSAPKPPLKAPPSNRAPSVPKPPPSRPAKPTSGLIAAPAKPVVTVYAGTPPVGPPPVPPSPPAPPAPRPPMQSYQVIDDNPTDVDGPPTMTIEGLEPAPAEPEPGNNKQKTGRR